MKTLAVIALASFAIAFAACDPETVSLGSGIGGTDGDGSVQDAGPLDLDGGPVSDAEVDAEPK